MRFFAAALAFILATAFVSTALHAETFDWPGHGKVSVTVPSGWNVRGKPTDVTFDLVPEPNAGPVVDVRITLFSAHKRLLKVEQLKDELEELTRLFVKGSIEKVSDPKPLILSQGSGLMVDLTDPSEVGKPVKPGEYKIMRCAVALLDERASFAANILFNDSSQPEVEGAMSMLSSLRFERSVKTGQALSTSSGPFTFTTPQSHVIVKVTDPSLHIDNTDPDPNYFKLSRNDPELNLSVWLRPASPDKGIKLLWQADSRALASNGLKPIRVKMLQAGSWNVAAYDIRLPSGTNAHLRAERAQAGTWIVLHIATTSTRQPAELRAELLDALGKVEVVEK